MFGLLRKTAHREPEISADDFYEGGRYGEFLGLSANSEFQTTEELGEAISRYYRRNQTEIPTLVERAHSQTSIFERDGMLGALMELTREGLSDPQEVFSAVLSLIGRGKNIGTPLTCALELVDYYEVPEKLLTERDERFIFGPFVLPELVSCLERARRFDMRSEEATMSKAALELLYRLGAKGQREIANFYSEKSSPEYRLFFSGNTHCAMRELIPQGLLHELERSSGSSETPPRLEVISDDRRRRRYHPLSPNAMAGVVKAAFDNHWYGRKFDRHHSRDSHDLRLIEKLVEAAPQAAAQDLIVYLEGTESLYSDIRASSDDDRWQRSHYGAQRLKACGAYGYEAALARLQGKELSQWGNFEYYLFDVLAETVSVYGPDVKPTLVQATSLTTLAMNMLENTPIDTHRVAAKIFKHVVRHMEATLHDMKEPRDPFQNAVVRFRNFAITRLAAGVGDKTLRMALLWSLAEVEKLEHGHVEKIQNLCKLCESVDESKQMAIIATAL